MIPRVNGTTTFTLLISAIGAAVIAAVVGLYLAFIDDASDGEQRTADEILNAAYLEVSNVTAPLEESLSAWGVLGYVTDFIKHWAWSIFAVMGQSSLFGWMFWSSRKFAKEGFPDMFSVSINMFVADDDDHKSSKGRRKRRSRRLLKKSTTTDVVLACRTLKEVPLQEAFCDETAVEVLKHAAQQTTETIVAKNSMDEDDETDGSDSTRTTNSKEEGPAPITSNVPFVNLEGLPNALRNVALLRSHCASELSALFGVFQALAAMRVGPVASRKFCWAVTYHDSTMGIQGKDYDVTAEDPLDQIKGVAKSFMTVSKLSSFLQQKDDSSSTELTERDTIEKTASGDDVSKDVNNTSAADTNGGGKNTSKQEHKKVDDDDDESDDGESDEDDDDGDDQDDHYQLSQSNKFRLILVELKLLRCAHLKTSDEIKYEVNGNYLPRRWETIQAMQGLFNLRTGRPNFKSTILCGTVTYSAPLLYETEPQAPWEKWEAKDGKNKENSK